MVRLSWLLVAVMTCVCIPGIESVCWDNSSICKDFSNKGRMLDCIRLCMSLTQTEIPQLSALALKVNNDNDLLLSIILATLASDNKMSDSDLRSHSEERRSYSMEHFRWGKPSGRKRRPVKVFGTSLEGGASSEGSFTPQARRQLSGNDDEGKGEPAAGDQNPGLPRARVGSKSHAPLGLQDRKDGAYQMSHFRWGSPPASKRGGLLKQQVKNPQGQLAKFFRNIIVKDVQRIMG